MFVPPQRKQCFIIKEYTVKTVQMFSLSLLVALSKTILKEGHALKNFSFVNHPTGGSHSGKKQPNQIRSLTTGQLVTYLHSFHRTYH